MDPLRPDEKRLDCARCEHARAPSAPQVQDPTLPGGRYRILTWGCQMNVHDSEKLAGALELAGYRSVAAGEDADVILLNTCSIREKAAEKVFSELGRLASLKQRNPQLVLGVCGCVAQQEGSRIFERAPFVDLVVGPRATGSLPAAVARIRAGEPGARQHVDIEYRRDSIQFPYDEIRREGIGRGKAFVTIVEGCNHRCTYCIVPTTRGREVCRDMESILDETRSLVERGVLEVEFLGQTVNAYRDGQGRTLADLLRRAAAIEGVRRIRFTTSHPAQMTEPLMDAMARAQPVVCPYLHLPVQSGSSTVLRAMRRGYDRDGYRLRIAGLRRRIPDLALGTDVIVGFPAESERDFEQTLALLEEIEFDTVYSFTYSPRPGTVAAQGPDEISAPVKHERLARLQARQSSIQEGRMQRWVGREVEVLVEGPSNRNPERWTGRTPENRVVTFGGPATPGTLKRIRISQASPFALRGSGVEGPA